MPAFPCQWRGLVAPSCTWDLGLRKSIMNQRYSGRSRHLGAGTALAGVRHRVGGGHRGRPRPDLRHFVIVRDQLGSPSPPRLQSNGDILVRVGTSGPGAGPGPSCRTAPGYAFAKAGSPALPTPDLELRARLGGAVRRQDRLVRRANGRERDRALPSVSVPVHATHVGWPASGAAGVVTTTFPVFTASVRSPRRPYRKPDGKILAGRGEHTGNPSGTDPGPGDLRRAGRCFNAKRQHRPSFRHGGQVQVGQLRLHRARPWTQRRHLHRLPSRFEFQPTGHIKTATVTPAAITTTPRRRHSRNACPSALFVTASKTVVIIPAPPSTVQVQRFSTPMAPATRPSTNVRLRRHQRAGDARHQTPAAAVAVQGPRAAVTAGGHANPPDHPDVGVGLPGQRGLQPGRRVRRRGGVATPPGSMPRRRVSCCSSTRPPGANILPSANRRTPRA